MTSTAFIGTVVFAASAGIATFFAPCAFPLLPGYVGYYMQRSDRETPGLLSAGAAGAGSLLTLGAVTALVFLFGRPLTSTLPVLEPVIGVLLVAFGVIVLLGWESSLTVPLPRRPETVLGFGIFGAVYALAAAGCVVPLFLGVLTQAMTLPVSQGLVALGVYGGAVTMPLVGVTLLTGVGVESWRSLGRYTGAMKRVAALVMIGAGIGQVYLSIVVLDVL